MNCKISHQILTYLIALVWLVNGLICKVLNFVPRHQEIVARILGEEFSRPLTILIGISEIIMAIWILSNVKPKFNAITQMVVILTMNILEFLLAPDLLLWGRLNLFFAILFVGFIYFNTFILSKKLIPQNQL